MAMARGAPVLWPAARTLYSKPKTDFEVQLPPAQFSDWEFERVLCMQEISLSKAANLIICWVQEKTRVDTVNMPYACQSSLWPKPAGRFVNSINSNATVASTTSTAVLADHFSFSWNLKASPNPDFFAMMHDDAWESIVLVAYWAKRACRWVK